MRFEPFYLTGRTARLQTDKVIPVYPLNFVAEEGGITSLWGEGGGV